MKKILNGINVFSLIVLFCAGSCHSGRRSGETANDEHWISLFNGKDLSGWQAKFTGHPLGYNLNNTFRVEDGLLRVDYRAWDQWNGQFGHLFYHQEFSHYRLRVEYRFWGDQVSGGPGWAFRNNGLMLHGQSAESMELDQDFPVSVEVQLLGGNGSGERSTLNVCTPGTNIVMDGALIEQHCTSSTSKTYHGDQWVTAEVEVRGGKIIRHLIDGEVVLEYSGPRLDPRDPNYQKLLPPNGDPVLYKGTISLQAESHPTDFRKIELLVLDPQ